MVPAETDPTAIVLTGLRVHSAELKRFVRRKVPDADVDDVLQTAAIRAVENANALRDTARIRPWLYRIHRNVIVDEVRSRARQTRLIEAMRFEAEPDRQQPEPACACSLAQARRLCRNYESILSLVDIGGTSLAKAAEVLNISVNNASVRLHRARAALKRRLKEHCGVTSLRACLDCRCSDEGCCSP